MSTSPDDETDITTAFEDLRREVSLVRAALEGLTSAREQAREHMPDYRPTLEDVAHNVAVLADKVARMDQRPALQLTPAQMVAELNKASEGARSADGRLIAEARDALTRSLGRIDGMIARGVAVDVQLRYFAWSCLGAALFGMLLWSMLPGIIARALPESWHVPEWMAARTMRLDQRAAGMRLIETARPQPEATSTGRVSQER